MEQPNTMKLGASDRIAHAIHERFGDQVQVPPLEELTAFALLNERAACRLYREDPVPETLLSLLFTTALAAPTKSDLQQTTIIRVKDRSTRAAIHALLPDAPWAAQAPEFLVFCADGWRFRQLFIRAGAPFINDHFDALFNATVDAAITLASFVGAAELAGLGTCPISQVRDRAGEIDKLLNLPERVIPVAGLVVGYPAGRGRISARLPLSSTVQTDRYDVGAVERDLGGYETRRGSNWEAAKVKQYGVPLRGDFGDFVTAKCFNLK